MTLYKIENLDPMMRVHPDAFTGARWIYSGLLEYMPRIENSRMKGRLEWIKGLIAEAITEGDKSLVNCLNDRKATRMLIALHTYCYPKGGFKNRSDFKEAAASVQKYVSVILKYQKRDDDYHWYRF